MEVLLIRKDLWDVVEPEEETTEGETEEDQGEEAEEAEDNRSRKDMAKARALMIEYAEKSGTSFRTINRPRRWRYRRLKCAIKVHGHFNHGLNPLQ